MNGITIYIDWPYFLGTVGTLIGIAYYANGRMTKIETTVEWLKDILLDIKARLDESAIATPTSSSAGVNSASCRPKRRGTSTKTR